MHYIIFVFVMSMLSKICASLIVWQFLALFLLELSLELVASEICILLICALVLDLILIKVVNRDGALQFLEKRENLTLNIIIPLISIIVLFPCGILIKII